jgi:GDPmannose 4,6-dehydratase
MKTALVTGITGQDGSYMAELLLAKGYRVIGLVRDVVVARGRLRSTLAAVELAKWDMLEQSDLEMLLSHYRPSEIYNFAAYSSGSGMYEYPVSIGDINGLAVARLLDAIRVVDRTIKFCQASSREVFGVAAQSPQSELTPANPRSPYGAAKHYADCMIRIYRQQYGIFACSAILFNHESPRRGLEFVTRKITHEAARIKLGLSTEIQLGSLEARRDWGYAGDTVVAMWLMLQQAEADDFVVATGATHSVREFCECAFGYLGLNYENYVRTDASVYRIDEPVTLVGNIDKAKTLLGWTPKVGFSELVRMMVDADLQMLKNKSGYEHV